jgi:hypothetical protein
VGPDRTPVDSTRLHPPSLAADKPLGSKWAAHDPSPQRRDFQQKYMNPSSKIGKNPDPFGIHLRRMLNM